MTELPSWRDTATRSAIEDFVASVTAGTDAVPVAERVAVFDNDGTLWSEKPMPTQLHYVVEQWRKRLAEDASLAARQPYTAVASGDLSWVGAAVDKHYAGDDADLKVLIGAIVEVTQGVSVHDYAESVASFYRDARHLTLGVPYSRTVYQPMVELLRFLEANGFTCYVVSAGERDFMRPMTEEYYGLPPERVVGSAYGLTYDEDTRQVRYGAALSFFDDGPEKPPRIWTRIGRRPLFAVGNSNGDMPMLDFTADNGRGLALLVHHDDDTDRGDTPYDKGAEQALAAAADRGYTVISVKDDWEQVFPTAPASTRDA
ncbi:haloacid dehalogenase-like hydrolase [Humibacter ginsenosidimutans]|uniref:Haloacid dehalogenase-like hydrolase n=2 Tax=Humibacter ginsenosidimutans TaxID=2599293 RepID=A0A5B8MB07_9MICO|nr:haloacid dehalogenase-like hydrolase [Humibacter ginsenosidimutans]